MLSKLFKYEIKATARIFLPLFAVLLAYSLIHKGISLLSHNEWVLPRVLSMVIYVMIVVGVMVMTIVITIQRFYKNLLTDEGYLMFTLPTKPWKHIVSKLVVSMFWTVISLVAAFISVIIIAYKEIFSKVSIHDIMDHFSSFFNEIGISVPLIMIEFLIAVIVSLASNVLIIYASIALGHLSNRHRILTSFAAFIALNAATQIIFTFVSFIAGLTFSTELESLIKTQVPPNSLFHAVIWFVTIFTALLSAGYFIITNYILTKRLNLE